MLAFTFTFLTPLAALLAVAAAVPLVALAVSGRRVDAVRRALRLEPPSGPSRRRRVAALAGIVGLLAVAAMQPVIRTHRGLQARTDAQLFVVLDTSRSMAAAPSAAAPTRLARAKRLAVDLGARFGDLPIGVATFTDRVLPDLFPTPDRAAFDSTVASVRVEDPPPQNVSTVATTFDALGALATNGFFPDGVHRRVVVLLTDGESTPFDAGTVASTLASHGVRLAVIRVGGGRDRVWAPSGKPEAGYRPDPSGARRSVRELEAALGDRPGESTAGFVRRAVGAGPSARVGIVTRTVTLAPVPAVASLVLLIVVFGRPPSRRRYRFGAGRANERVSA
jgi:von Willebrand factor type A domain